jgi:hypothetical protein
MPFKASNALILMSQIVCGVTNSDYLDIRIIEDNIKH